MLDEIVISSAIIKSYTAKLLDSLEIDVAIVGAGPSGLVCAYYLGKEDITVSVFERKLSIGGGIWGGGMGFNEIVVQKQGKEILDEFGVSVKEYQKEYWTVDAIEMVSCLGMHTIKSGAKIFNLIEIEDCMIRAEKVEGLVLNSSAIKTASLHVDPLTIRAKFVVDATGHDAEVVRNIVKKQGPKLFTDSGDIEGEKPMWAEIGEKDIIKNTKEVFPNVYVTGMAANAVFGSPRMGAIFGGMLLSGKCCAEKIKERL